MSKEIAYQRGLKSFSQKLRREMTSQERRLWYDFLKNHPRQFRRQKPIGPYIVDFFCTSAKLIVELDGSQHNEPGNRQADEARDIALTNLGYTVLRFSNHEVDTQFDEVCAAIKCRLGL